MKIRRAIPRQQFLQIRNEVIRDYRLSWRARGLLAELLSYPPGWEPNIDELVEAAKQTGGHCEGRDAMRKAASELESVGYLIRRKHQNERGQWVTELEIYDEVQVADDGKSVVGPTSANTPKPKVAPTTGKPVIGKPGVNMINEPVVTQHR